MQESMYKYMKVGVVHFMAYPQIIKGDGPVVECIEKTAQDDFFNAIEITWVKDAAAKQKVKEILDSSHMTIGFGGQPPLLTQKLNLNALDKAERGKAVAACKSSLDDAAFFGAKRCAFLSGPYEENQKAAATDALIDSLSELCEYGQTRGVDVTLETFDYDIDKKSLIGPSKEAAELARTLRKKYPTFGLMVDLSHIPMYYETPEECVTTVQEFLVHAHMGNCVIKDPAQTAYGDMHPRFGFPGGENDVPQVVDFLRVLLKVGFLNEKNPPVVSFEVKPWGDESSEVVLANAKRVLKEAWALV